MGMMRLPGGIGYMRASSSADESCDRVAQRHFNVFETRRPDALEIFADRHGFRGNMIEQIVS
jgi:hypothetical protein